jgi:hypothetical protein
LPFVPRQPWADREREEKQQRFRAQLEREFGMDTYGYILLAEDVQRSKLCLLLHKTPDEVRAIDPLDREQVWQQYLVDQELEREAVERARQQSGGFGGRPKVYVVD